ncbi:hypothetical protein [Tepidimicrobium xylanilyticum]|uniref:Uncharacterized protein n=1 Tax=Tepidimicrobium xylanilyticum TaxID=1123352 RepID=A0A1H2VAA6_9FIRM|nr:hypothetical protein [Tepidimicrobium xylanilyticum]GMG96688.1 hypothetical protein EN5CB1_15140 [Tepidimicrobium xylanilyticum]SDW65262.1 hypothetical protein SAMN05660923_01060 [Tepidimicrobium xylanilyticum]
MSRVTLPSRKPIREYERDVKIEVDKKNDEEPFEFTRKDILAMIIAGYQVIMPLVLIGVLVMSVFVYVFLNFYLK